MRQTNTKVKIVSAAKSFLQQHGYHGFSFQHIADELELKKASLYDHFPSKETLMIAVIAKYREDFDVWTEGISRLAPLTRVRKVFEAFHYFSCDQRKVCPVLSLGGDFESLSVEVKEAVEEFITYWLAWLEKQIQEGQMTGSIRKDLKAKKLASLIYGQGIGAQYQARLMNDPSLTLASGEFVVSFLRATKGKSKS